MVWKIAVEIEKILQLDHFLLKEIIFEIFVSLAFAFLNGGIYLNRL